MVQLVYVNENCFFGKVLALSLAGVFPIVQSEKMTLEYIVMLG